jgi:hypothetical protein
MGGFFSKRSGFFSKSIDFTKDFDLAINEVKIIIDKKKLTKENFVDTIFLAIFNKTPKQKNKSHFDLTINDLKEFNYKLGEIQGQTPIEKEELTLFLVESSSKIDNIIKYLNTEKIKASNAPNASKKIENSMKQSGGSRKKYKKSRRS